MKSLINKSAFVGFVVLLTFAAYGKTGESWKLPGSISAGKSKTVELVAEKDLDWNEYTEDGVYYFKITCKRGKGYTVYTSNSSDIDNMSVSDDSWYKDYGDKDPPNLPSFSDSMDSDGNYRSILASADWDSESAASGTFYICVEGAIGQSVTVHFEEGEFEEPVQSGTLENPAGLSVGASGSRSGTLIGDYYYFSANLTAGKKYTFWTSGGTADAPLGLDVEADSEVEAPELRDMTGVDENNGGLIVIPAMTGSHIIVVDGPEDGRFTLNYGEMAARVPSAHKATAVTATELATGYADDSCEPGHRNDPDSGFFDKVIDQALYKIPLAKGATYAFATVGATAPIIMEVYDAKGAVLVSRKSGTTRSEFDCAISYTAAAAGDFWVGVCEDLADDENDDLVGMTLTFTAMSVTPGKDGLVDSLDAADDVYTGATGLKPGMGEFVDNGPHTLGVADFVDYFRIDARVGLSYELKAVLDESAEAYDSRMEGFKLKATIYTLTTSKTLKEFSTIADLVAGGSFTAGENASYYIAVAVDGGSGFDYGPYVLQSKATGAGGLGMLTVNIGGASFAEGATWKIKAAKGAAAEPQYPGGASIYLAAGEYTLTFSTVKDWTAPADAAVKVNSGEVTVKNFKYCDVYDVSGSDATAGDGSRTGKKVTTLKPSSKEDSVSRSLWSDDEADWYKVAVGASTYYRFALADDAALGDAEIVVYRENGVDIVACGTSVEFLCRETKSATYWVCVGHATAEKADSRYKMAYSSTAVGAVAFKGDMSVKDTATSVSLTVKRTGGKDGRVRVRYSTFAGTAKPGIDYEPQSGVLEWANGDTKDKTVTVPLIPDLVAKWQPDRAFTMQIAAIAPDGLEADEIVPAIGTPSVANVTIVEAAKKNTGTISLVGYGAVCDEFATPKKPAVTMPAGEKLEFWFERTGGSDSRVAVAVSPTKGTALADTHFDATPQTLVWEDGETGMKAFTLETFATDEAYMSAKALTVKAAADKTVSADVAKLGVASASVTLMDPKVTKTVETYAAGFAKADGIAVKAGKSDTWYFNETGDLVSVTPAAGGKAELTVTLTGAGRFMCRPTFNADAGTKSVCTMTVGKETVSLAPGSETVVTRYLAKGGTVKFTLSRAKTANGASDVDEDISLTFADMGDGEPFEWKLLPTPALVSPLPGEVTLTGSCGSEEHEQVKFSWSDAEDPEVVYVFTLDADKKNLGTAKAMFAGEVLSSCMKLIRVYCEDCVAAPIAGQLASEKTYYWRVDTTFADEGCTITNVNSAVWQMTPLECTGAPYPVVASGTDAFGNEVSSIAMVGSAHPVTLVQGVTTRLVLRGEREEFDGEKTSLDGATFSMVKGSSLPAGLALKDGVISGVPTKVGVFTSIVQAFHKAKGARAATPGATMTFAFEVRPIGLAEGSFNGFIRSSDERLSEDEKLVIPAEAKNQVGFITVAAASGGKVSAKVSVGGATYSYAANAWSGTTVLDNGQLGVWATITNVMKITTAKTSTSAAQTYNVPSVLTIAASCGEVADREALDTPMSVALDLSFLSEDKQTAVTNVLYAGHAYRDNRKLASLAADIAPFVGYYTISLAPQEPVEFIKGYGYLTMTVDAKGGVKLAGLLADGATKPSASSAAYVSEGTVGEPELIVPVYYAKGTVAFGGEIVIRLDASGVPVVASYDSPGGSCVWWINGDQNSTYEGGSGFSMAIEPVGGFYNTLYNLQAYYLGYNLLVKEVDVDADIPEELLGANEEYVCYPGMFSEYLTMAGNAITAPKQALAYRETMVGGKKTKLIDWENSVNPANLTFSFKQATGIYSGKFDLYAGNAFDDDWLETKQVKLGSFSHQGVLVMNRDENNGILSSEDAVMPGFYLVPVKVAVEGSARTRSFTASMPFAIVPEEREKEWDDPYWEESLP